MKSSTTPSAVSFALFVLASDTHLENARALVPALQAECRLASYALDVRAFFYGSPFPKTALDDLFEVSAVLVKEDFRSRRIVDRLTSGIGRLGFRQPAQFLRRRHLASLLKARLGDGMATAIFCNDRFFPERDLMEILKSRNIPCFLVQESLRKDLRMSESAGPRHGTGGADHIFAWGETSCEYFQAVRVPGDRVTITGNPRFDQFRGLCASMNPATIRARNRLQDSPAILLATNPVYAMKMKDAPSPDDCVQTIRTVSELASMLDKVVIWKPHPLEKSFTERSDVIELLATDAATLRISWEMSLPEAIAVSDRVLVFNSTVALEAASMGRPAGLLSLVPWDPGVDFVERGIAVLLDSKPAVQSFLSSPSPLPNLLHAVGCYSPLDGKSAERIINGIRIALVDRGKS